MGRSVPAGPSCGWLFISSYREHSGETDSHHRQPRPGRTGVADDRSYAPRQCARHRRRNARRTVSGHGQRRRLHDRGHMDAGWTPTAHGRLRRRVRSLRWQARPHQRPVPRQLPPPLRRRRRRKHRPGRPRHNWRRTLG
jgi:hypothetical protein